MICNPYTQAHPDLQTPWQEWAAEQTLHLVAVYSNPFRWNTRRKLFNQFCRQIVCSPNVKLYVGELAYGERPFEVTEPGNACHVQMRTSEELWHKENLIDLVTSIIPTEAKYLGYSDGDFTFTRYDWALEAIQLLQHHQFVQLFSSYAPLSSQHRPTRIGSSFAWNYLHRPEVFGNATSPADSNYPLSIGAPGGAWVYRRSAYDAVGGMIDHAILGSADMYMAKGLVGMFDAKKEREAGYHPQYVKMVSSWQERAKVLTRNIGCVENHAIHHFHGSYKNRGYGARWTILKKWQYDPSEDVVYDSQGLLKLAGNKPGLRDDIRAYFLSRNEDSIELAGEKHII